VGYNEWQLRIIFEWVSVGLLLQRDRATIITVEDSKILSHICNEPQRQSLNSSSIQFLIALKLDLICEMLRMKYKIQIVIACFIC